MITNVDADSLLAGELGQWLAGQNDARDQARRAAWKRWIGGLVIGLPLLTGFWSNSFGWKLVGFAGIVVIGLGIGLGIIIRQKMVKTLKAQMNAALAKALGISYSLAASTGDEFELARRFELLPPYTSKRTEDRWEGELGGNRFSLYEAVLIERRGSGKDARNVTVFSGVVLKIHFARDFRGVTLVERQRIRLALFGDSQTKNGIRLDRVKMVDPRFEQAFDVYASDAVEARYLVHPAYCERLIALEERFEGKKLKALFYQGDVIVTVASDNLFESGSLDPARDRALLARTIAQFQAMADLVTGLNERARGGAL